MEIVSGEARYGIVFPGADMNLGFFSTHSRTMRQAACLPSHDESPRVGMREDKSGRFSI
jgi:hypothetical protein